MRLYDPPMSLPDRATIDHLVVSPIAGSVTYFAA